MATASEAQQRAGRPPRVGRHEDRPLPRAHAGVLAPRVPRRALARPDARPLLHVGARPVGDRANRLVGGPVEAQRGDVRQLPRDLRQRADHVLARDHALDRARRDDPPHLRRVARRLRLRLARVPGARLALPRRGRDARRPDPDGADPDLLALQRPRALRHRARADPLPHGVRTALRDLPAQELLHRDTRATCSRRLGSTARPSSGFSSG